MNYSKFNNYIFDLDMTLVDTSIGSSHCYKEAFQAAGSEYNADNLQQYMSEFLDVTYARINNPMISYAQFEQIFYENSHRVMAQKSIIYDDVLALLRCLIAHDKRLAIVTNKDRLCVNRIIEIQGINKDWFDCIICCDDVENKKPHPESLLKCINTMEWEPSGCLYIGDNGQDLVFARRAGIVGVIVDRNGTSLSDKIIPSLNYITATIV